MNSQHTVIRPFIRNGHEPNVSYRPWLEDNIGTQSVDWDWGIDSYRGNQLFINFASKESAVLFEIVFPRT